MIFIIVLIITIIVNRAIMSSGDKTSIIVIYFWLFFNFIGFINIFVLLTEKGSEDQGFFIQSSAGFIIGWIAVWIWTNNEEKKEKEAKKRWEEGRFERELRAQEELDKREEEERIAEKERKQKEKRQRDRARRIRKIEIKGMSIVMSYEKDKFGEPKDISSQNIGYDIVSTRDYKDRYIEVKAKSKDGDILITENEWKTAERCGKNYYLYVVLNCSTDQPELCIISDPCRNLDANYDNTQKKYVINISQIKQFENML